MILSDLGHSVCLGFTGPSGLAGELGHGLGVGLIAAGLFLFGAELFRTGFRRSGAKSWWEAPPGKQLQVISVLGEIRPTSGGGHLGPGPAAGRYLILRDDESSLQFVVETLDVTAIDESAATDHAAGKGSDDTAFRSYLAAVAGRRPSTLPRWNRRR